MSTQSDTSDTDGLTRVEYPELQDGWEWRSGETSRSYYTLWFGTEYAQGGDLVHDGCIGGYDGEIFWDKQGPNDKHTVCLYPIERIDENGDPITRYPEMDRTFDSKQEAVNAIPGLIRELKERHG